MPKIMKILYIFPLLLIHCQSRYPISPKYPCSRLQHWLDNLFQSYKFPNRERELQTADLIFQICMALLGI